MSKKEGFETKMPELREMNRFELYHVSGINCLMDRIMELAKLVTIQTGGSIDDVKMSELKVLLSGMREDCEL